MSAPPEDGRPITQRELREAVAMIVRYINAANDLQNSNSLEQVEERKEPYFAAARALEAKFMLQELLGDE